MRKTTAFLIGAAWVSGILSIVAGSPGTSFADIYRWEDDSGVVHFTDTPGNIPEKYRNRKKMILQTPPGSGRPSVSTVDTPPSPAPRPVPEDAGPEPEKPAAAGEAERLRSRIEAKEQFIKGIDLKRSHTLRPMGNRFVSPEDLELYRKYSEELPNDRARLKEIESGSP